MEPAGTSLKQTLWVFFPSSCISCTSWGRPCAHMWGLMIQNIKKNTLKPNQTKSWELLLLHVWYECIFWPNIILTFVHQTSGPGLISGPKYCGEQTTQVDLQLFSLDKSIIVLLAGICYRINRQSRKFLSDFTKTYFQAPSDLDHLRLLSYNMYFTQSSPIRTLQEIWIFEQSSLYLIGPNWYLSFLGMVEMHWSRTHGRQKTCTRWTQKNTHTFTFFLSILPTNLP